MKKLISNSSLAFASFALLAGAVAPNSAFAGGNKGNPQGNYQQGNYQGDKFYQGGAGLPSDLPPISAKPGQCYARVLIPAVYKNVPTEVVTQEAYENFETKEPVFNARPETIVTKDGYTRYIVTEPVFRAENVTVTTRPAYERLVAKPAVLGAKTETVVIREPKMVWRPGTNLSGVRRLDSNTGEIYCLVEERGVTQTVVRKFPVKPSTVERVMIPAETQTVTRNVLVQPSSVKEVNVPAETKTVLVKEMVTPAMERKVAIPEQRGTINRQELVTPEHYEWVQVECDHDGANGVAVPFNDKPQVQPPIAKPPIAPRPFAQNNAPIPTPVPVPFNDAPKTNTVAYSVSSLQTALAKRGYYRGPVDGIYGTLTRQAVAKFQADNNLESNGKADAAVAKALGL